LKLVIIGAGNVATHFKKNHFISVFDAKTNKIDPVFDAKINKIDPVFETNVLSLHKN